MPLVGVLPELILARSDGQIYSMINEIPWRVESSVKFIPSDPPNLNLWLSFVVATKWPVPFWPPINVSFPCLKMHTSMVMDSESPPTNPWVKFFGEVEWRQHSGVLELYLLGGLHVFKSNQEVRITPNIQKIVWHELEPDVFVENVPYIGLPSLLNS